MWSIVPGVATAQNASPPDCGPSEVRAGRLVPQVIDGGLQFSGKDGDVVTEPLMLPEGPIIVTAAMESPSDYAVNRVTIIIPNESTATTYDTLPVSENGPYSGTVVSEMQTGGEVFLSFETAGPWTAILEF